MRGWILCAMSFLLASTGAVATDLDQALGTLRAPVCLALSFDQSAATSAASEGGQWKPVGPPHVRYIGNSKVSTQQYEILSPENGPAATATLTCTGTCTGNGCGVSGCDPFGGNCTGCNCTGGFCGYCTCTKTSTAS
jgi:hypothetical protein